MEYLLKNKDKVIIVISILVIVLLIWIVVHVVNEQNSNVSKGEFNSIKEVLNYMDTKYIKQKNSKQDGFDREIYLTFKFPPIDENGTIYENYYNEVTTGIAEVLGYINFILVDEKNNINIKVECDKDKKIISSFIVNNDKNYFAKLESKNETATYVKEEKKKVTINSSLLNNIVKNNWNSNNIKFGSKISTVDNYDIYFNEGLKVRIIDDTVFNIIFTNKYSGEIVDGIKTSMSIDDIVKKMGNPNYGSIGEGLIGYACDKMYVFCSSNSISIYPYIDYSESKKISMLIDSFSSYLPESYGEFIALFSESSQNAPILDKYEYLPDNGLIVQSSLMGIQFAFNTSKKDGIYFYSNFDGYLYGDKRLSDIASGNLSINYSNVYIENENLIYKNEKERTTKYIYDIDSGLSNGKFEIYFVSSFNKSINSYGLDGINVVVKNNIYPDFNINNIVKTPLIVSDYKFVYSVENSGIYLCDVSTREQKSVVTGEGKFNIKEYKDGILKYDDKEIKLKLD